MHRIDHVNETRDQREPERCADIANNYATIIEYHQRITSISFEKPTKCKRKLLIAAVVVKIPNIQRRIDNEK